MLVDYQRPAGLADDRHRALPRGKGDQAGSGGGGLDAEGFRAGDIFKDDPLHGGVAFERREDAEEVVGRVGQHGGGGQVGGSEEELDAGFETAEGREGGGDVGKDGIEVGAEAEAATLGHGGEGVLDGGVEVGGEGARAELPEAGLIAWGEVGGTRADDGPDWGAVARPRAFELGEEGGSGKPEDASVERAERVNPCHGRRLRGRGGVEGVEKSAKTNVRSWLYVS